MGGSCQLTPEREEMSRRRTTKVVNYSEKIYDESLEEDFEGELEEEPAKPASQSQSSASASSTQSPSKGPKGEGSKKTSKQTTPDTPTNGVGHDLVPSNWQPRSHPSDALTGVLDLEDAYIKGGKLHLSSGTTYAPGDHCYIVSEPPGEPYYIGRIMDFVINEENPPSTDGNPDKHWSTLNPRQKYPASQFLFQVNWFYRPKDISKHVADSRLLYATMHSDICSLQSMRGKCTVTHRTDIIDIEDYRLKPNHFYFTQFYDRYILRFYEIVPTHTMVNIPKEVSQVLCERFKYAIMEINRKQEFCEPPKECVTCSNWSSPDDSVECAHCRTNFHMMCVTPPLFKKPTRGFGWSCAACNRKVEKRLKEAKGEFFDDVIPELTEPQPDVKPETSPSMSRSTSPDKHRSRYEELAEAFGKDNSLSEEQKHQLQLWPFRYLGVYAKIEDVLDVDDRIYPRAVSRLGPKHQAVVDSWPGRPVKYVGPFRDAPVKKRGKKKNDDGFQFDPEKPWIQDRPIGYIDRGGDDTVKLMWDCEAGNKAEEEKPMLIEDFLESCKPHAKKLGVRHDTPNYFDLCLKALMDAKFDPAVALKAVNKFTVKTIDEPVFSAEDKRRFEEGVGKYGSELHPVTLEIGTQTPGHVVRYYYNWKKTPSGRKIWGNYPGRKHKKGGAAAEEDKKKKPKVDIGDDSDGSAYDVNKAVRHKKSFECKHCLTTTSPCWKRAPGGGDDESNQVQALCQRCARLWRRYAIIWEDSDDINRKLIARGGKLWAKKVEAELLDDTRGIFEERQRSCSKKGGSRKKSTGAATATSVPSLPIPHIPTAREAAAAAAREEKQRLEEERKAEEERERKARAEAREREKERKEKEDRERRDKERKEKEKRDKERKEREKKAKEEKLKKEDRESKKRTHEAEEQAKKKAKTIPLPKSPSPDFVAPVSYTTKERPGHVFRGDRTPYRPFRPHFLRKVLKDACNVCGVSNERKVVSCKGCQVTVHRECYGITDQEPELPSAGWYCDLCTNDAKPNVTTHYQCVLCPIRDHDSEPSGKQYPPDPLKRTEHNHWAHIRCSVWNNRLIFGTPNLEPVLGLAPDVRHSGTGICFICKTGAGVCINCRCCGMEYHAGCAYRQDYVFGFEFLPPSEVRPGYPIVEFNGEKGAMCATSYCYWHAPQSVILPAEADQKQGKTALQVFIENYKIDPQWKKCASDASLAMQLIYDVNHDPLPPPDIPELNKKCYKCHNGVSPFWRKTEEGDICHACFHGNKIEHPDLSIGLPEFSQPMRKLMHFDVLYRTEEVYKRAQETQHMNHVPPPPPPAISQIHPALESYNSDPMNIRARAETSSI